MRSPRILYDVILELLTWNRSLSNSLQPLNIAEPFGQNYLLDARRWNHCENGARLGQGEGWGIAAGPKECNSTQHESATYNLEVGDALKILNDLAELK